MQGKGLWWVAQIAILAVGLGASAPAQSPKEVHFRGTINDYTPQNMPSTVSGPWQVAGHWSLTLKRDGTADFSAALNMVRSDLGVTLSSNPDLNSAAARNAHTHHITLVGGAVTFLSNDIRITGSATITANGNVPPPFGGNSSLQIDIIGGNTVTYSNIKVTFLGDAQNHFGVAPMNGVVRSVRTEEHHR
ncbi:MAG TPA: hypothetical protein VHV29_03115 [Terriglobales bacterium]|jgi:hypothetical protein|nr:hypothetical protein [Terriglobales bacterium]